MIELTKKGREFLERGPFTEHWHEMGWEVRDRHCADVLTGRKGVYAALNWAASMLEQALAAAKAEGAREERERGMAKGGEQLTKWQEEYLKERTLLAVLEEREALSMELAREIDALQDVVGWQPGDSRNRLIEEIADKVDEAIRARSEDDR